MCGISGFYSNNNFFTPSDLNTMNHCLLHRGPDAGGVFSEMPCGLAHRRLSIIDLSEKANQPMYSHSGRYVMIFNGEIYNFKELALQFKIEQKTSSDSEIILELFEKEGPGFVNHLNGMFAIAIYDKKTEELWLFRDRMGIKPIYYFDDGKNFAFSSELKALTILPQIKAQLQTDDDAVSAFLHLGYIPQPYSIYKQIKKFPSASYLHLTKNNRNFTCYWDLAQVSSRIFTGTYQNAKEQYHRLLQSSVGYRLISDVSYGTFLSGGIDSSLVTAIAAKTDSKPLKTFTIGFHENRINEAGHAKKIAQHLGTDHHEFYVSYQEAREIIPKMQDFFDEPFADSSAVPTFLVSKLAKQHVTMTLSGDGGDELFMGYGSYSWAKRLSNPILKTFRNPVSFLLRQHNSRSKRAAMLFNYENPEHLKSHIFSQEQYLFSETETIALTGKTSPIFNEINLRKASLSPRGQQALFDLQYYLKDDLLVKVDRTSMASSLETRVPLLDYRLVEFALSLPDAYKIKNGIAKFMLKDILNQYIPKPLFDRPKQGFAIPLSVWMKNELKAYFLDYLSPETVRKHGLVNPLEVEKYKQMFYSKNLHFYYNRLWQLVVLHQWAEKNLI